jgi:hypothetical protein
MIVRVDSQDRGRLTMVRDGDPTIPEVIIVEDGDAYLCEPRYLGKTFVQLQNVVPFYYRCNTYWAYERNLMLGYGTTPNPAQGNREQFQERNDESKS